MLAPGEWVLLVDNDSAELSGRVDAVTEDGLSLWLHPKNGAGRRLFTRTDAALTWRVSEKQIARGARRSLYHCRLQA